MKRKLMLVLATIFVLAGMGLYLNTGIMPVDAITGATAKPTGTIRETGALYYLLRGESR